MRAQHPPTEYDDKGKVKVWTQKELRELKGNSKLPGYPSDFDRLVTGQIVTVYLPKPSKAAPKSTDKTDKSAKSKAPAFDTSAKPEVVMIVIEFDAPKR